MWDESKIQVKEVLEGSFSISICISFSSLTDVWLTNVYGPTDYLEKKSFWTVLLDLACYVGNCWCIGGDFNAIRWTTERSSCVRISKAMKNFNSTIEALEVLEIPFI